MYAAVTVTSALDFKGVGPKPRCLSTDIYTIFRRTSVKGLHSTVFRGLRDATGWHDTCRK